MKQIIFLFLITIFAGSGFAQNRTAKILTNAKEDGQVTQRTFIPPSIVDFVAPPFSIESSMSFWDYMTNGANMHNLKAYGDTLILCYPGCDSTDPLGATTRIAYYMVSYNGGQSWDAPLAISSLPFRSAYPNVYGYLSGGRQVAISGRKYSGPTGADSRGGAWKDAFLGLGSFNGSNVPQDGRDFYGASQNGGIIGGLFSVPNGTIEDTLWYNKYNAGTNTFGTRVKVADPGLAQIGFNVRYCMASDDTGNNLVAMWYKDSTGSSFSKMMTSTSVNGGTSWSSPQIIQRTRGLNSILAPGDTCMTWFGMDCSYKPGTTNYGLVWSTLGPTADNTAGNTASNGSCKILFWAPNVNGGVPTIVAGKQNMTLISDTSQFNNRQALQVGVLPVSHPSIAYTTDGKIYVAFSGYQPGDSIDGFTLNDIWWTMSVDNGATWMPPANLTNSHTDDELYPTLSATGTKVYIHYQSTKGAGSQSFTDNAPTYRVYQCVRMMPVGINNISSTVPEKFSLKQNYPNPFNPTTSIRFDVVKSAKMTLKIYDLSGKLVETLIDNESVSVGTNEVVFDASKLSSGVYLYTLSSENFKETKKMMLVK